MTAKRLENIALVFGILAAWTVYSSAKTPPIKTSGLFAALLFALFSYFASKRAVLLKNRKQLEKDNESTEKQIDDKSSNHQ